MQIILLENIQNVGRLGDTVKVKSGYARNFLIPQGKAVQATPANEAEFEARRADLERQQAQVLDAAAARAAAVEGQVLTIVRKAGGEGRLFGSVGAQDVVEALAVEGHEVQRSEVRLPSDNIRQIGEYAVTLHFHADVEAAIQVNVEAEGARDELDDED